MALSVKCLFWGVLKSDTLKGNSQMNSTFTTQQKALAINLAAKWYGSIAGIGGGKEVAHWFFQIGGAAGSVAKSISAYDMAVSDGIYGSAKDYVSRDRLYAMLEHEFALVSDQPRQKHGDSRAFFAYANTVVTRRFNSAECGRGWIGIRFQTRPREEPSQITLRVPSRFIGGSGARCTWHAWRKSD